MRKAIWPHGPDGCDFRVAIQLANFDVRVNVNSATQTSFPQRQSRIWAPVRPRNQAASRTKRKRAAPVGTALRNSDWREALRSALVRGLAGFHAAADRGDQALQVGNGLVERALLALQLAHLRDGLRKPCVD